MNFIIKHNSAFKNTIENVKRIEERIDTHNKFRHERI